MEVWCRRPAPQAVQQSWILDKVRFLHTNAMCRPPHAFLAGGQEDEELGRCAVACDGKHVEEGPRNVRLAYDIEGSCFRSR